MKRSLILILVFIAFRGWGQINLLFQIPIWDFETVHLSNTETKYFDNDQWVMNHQHQFTLYNLDGSLYKTINMTLKPNNDSSFFYGIGYISRTLFDNDPSNIEYMVAYQWDSLPPHGKEKYELKIIREDGTVLLDEINATCIANSFICSTEEGTRLTLDYYYANTGFYITKVFSLPGEIPTSVFDSNPSLSNKMILYPNPNNGSFYIKSLTSPGESSRIYIYSSSGILLKSYRSTNDITHIQNLNLPDGLYFINTITNKSSSIDKLILKK